MLVTEPFGPTMLMLGSSRAARFVAKRTTYQAKAHIYFVNLLITTKVINIVPFFNVLRVARLICAASIH